MFENYSSMTPEEKAAVKAAHVAIREHTPCREGNLAWGFVRGFPYRRIERTTRTQVLPDGSVFNHNPPDARWITSFIARHVPGFAVDKNGGTVPHPDVVAWLKNPAGAIPVPVRVKRPYVRPEAA